LERRGIKERAHGSDKACFFIAIPVILAEVQDMHSPKRQINYQGVSHGARTVKSLLIFYLLLGTMMRVHGELILTNFIGSMKPSMKIMPIGDSITDDCEINGAWRLYLQPLLQSHGYFFKFVGRQASIPVNPSFTSVNHEGYCGAVIAPPGVFAVHQYTAANAYLLNIVSDALAVTNNTPDLVLLLIGANDIGRGRDPYQVATNDMPNLLDLIFSNVPNVNIIIAKITSLQNANISGLTYSNYATNVPIYNAALQSMVNQRRALGQNVFLADMYSAVDYNTMFMADHVHPNATGLQAIANEWLARIQAITIRPNTVTSTIIHGGDTWKYSDTGQDLGTNWTQINYDDSGWSNGVARLGYGDIVNATTVNFGPDPDNKYTTTYFRHSFVMPNNVNFTNLNFRVNAVDSAVVWLNGAEMFRTNLPAGPIAYTNFALSQVTGYPDYVFYQTNQVVSNLPSGNLVAVELHQSSPTNSDLGLDLELIGTGVPVTPPSLSIGLTGNNIALGWPVTNANGYALYSTTDLTVNGGWAMAIASLQTNGGQVTATLPPDPTTRFYRLQKP
jgi:lysophospholipase L1-like esterase